jgi:hypothetical protein
MANNEKELEKKKAKELALEAYQLYEVNCFLTFRR